MLHKIMAFIAEFHMIGPNDRVIAGVSGGADSVCLFYLLLALKEQIPFDFSVVHVDHGIRKDAGEDAAYVRRLCQEHDVAFTMIEEDVPAYAAAHHLGEEEAGRYLRYQAFAQVNARVYDGGAKIAVAHNKNDRAETVLFQLFRGSGLHGMCGMKPVQGNVIRPLLCVTREEIEAYLAARDISYRTDSTNAEDGYARNRIRHHILNYAEQEVCQGSTEHISRTADMLTQAAAYLDAQTEEAYQVCVTEEANPACVTISADAFARLHPYLQGSLLHRCFGKLTPAAKDMTSAHVKSVCALFEKQVGRVLALPNGMTAERTYQGVFLGYKTDFGKKEACEDSPVFLEGESGEARFGGRIFRFRVFSCEINENILQTIPKNVCKKWFDYDKIKKPIAVRYRKTGDELAINAAGGTKSLKKYMIDEKIPSGERHQIPLIAEEDHVLWVTGYRISEAYKVTADTKRIIEIYMSGGKEDG
ncbi:MAG: tRNA lysidine(34) synthetase TilS [Lachnospiraceae bacterium]|nr:tRNA lysidine(34) synthetase TilS [Lachnospiraceae bacterium]